MLNFLRKIKGDGTPSLAEAESLSRKIKALDANVVQLVTTLRAIQSAPRGAQKARDYLPQLLEAIRFNLEEELNLAKAIEKETRQEPSKSNYNQFSDQQKQIIYQFCSRILGNYDTLFWKYTTYLSHERRLKEIMDENFNINLEDYKYLITNLSIDSLSEKKIIQVNRCIKVILDQILETFLTTRRDELNRIYTLRVNKLFSLTSDEYKQHFSKKQSPSKWFNQAFTKELETIIKS